MWKTGLPVRSAVLKPHAGELVVGWVTTSESSLLYVFGFGFALYFVLMHVYLYNNEGKPPNWLAGLPNGAVPGPLFVGQTYHRSTRPELVL